MKQSATGGQVLASLRQKKGWSQEDLAARLFVSRQAVSKWELDESVPNPETLKQLSDLFRVSINTLLGAAQPGFCECCGMPLNDDILGKDEDGNPDERYCQWCLVDGTFPYQDFEEMTEYLCQNVPAHGKKEEEGTRDYFERLLLDLPYWKQKAESKTDPSSRSTK